jgi:lysophospholipid acyltransferase (LPLAT)-like uncharacterized protein
VAQVKQTNRWSIPQRLALATLPSLAAWLLRLIGSTLRYEIIHEPGFVVTPPPSPGIYCVWHRAVLLAACHFRAYRGVVLISQSFDGELITRAANKMGYQAARGSSTRGGFDGLLELKKAVDDGIPALFTADGPRGPIYRTKVGPVKLAQVTGYPINSFYLLPERAWQVNSWDRLLIPKPFSNVIVSFVHALPVSATADPAEIESRRQDLEGDLERCRLNAENHLAAKRAASKRK